MALARMAAMTASDRFASLAAVLRRRVQMQQNIVQIQVRLESVPGSGAQSHAGAMIP